MTATKNNSTTNPQHKDSKQAKPQQDQELLSAYEKAAQEEDIDPRCIPIRLEEPPPVDEEIVYPNYSEEEHEIWRTLYNRQVQFLPGRACTAYLEGVRKLKLTPDRIPALRDVSRVLKETTGWRVARIPGLLHERDFFDLLSRRIFPSTDYIRRKDELDYTPAPDIFHDVFGHTPMLTQPDYAEFYQRLAKVAMQAEGEYRIQIERLHWFTIEFGLIKENGNLRIFGAGILSSYQEVQHALSDKVEKLPFDPDRIVKQDYVVYKLQERLFVLESFEQLVEEFTAWARRQGFKI